MIRIVLLPLMGIIINENINITLGSKMEELKNLIGIPNLIMDNKLYYHEFDARFDFNEQDELEFIEFIGGPFTEKVELSIYGVNPFKIPAMDLVDILVEHSSNIDDSDADLSYAFLDISVGIFREENEKMVKESFEELENESEELKMAGRYERIKKDLEMDLEKSRYFWTIGIGIENYYTK
jgi:hypothetical protein